VSKKAKADSKPNYWNDHLHRFKKSGLSRAAYCREHALNYDQMGYYLKKAKADSSSAAPENSTTNYINNTIGDFIPVQVTPAAPPMIELTLSQPDGAELRWSAHWGPQQVIEFIKQWRAASQ
jgi:hypothetical protein